MSRSCKEKDQVVDHKYINSLAVQAKSDPSKINELISLVTPYIRYLVSNVYRRFVPKGHFEDCFHEAILAVYDAVRRYDETINDFTYYLSWWVRSRLSNYMKAYAHGWMRPFKAEQIGCMYFSDFDSPDDFDISQEDNLSYHLPDLVYNPEQSIVDMIALNEVVQKIGGRERDIVVRYLNHQTLSEIGRTYKISTERVRQLIKKINRLVEGSNGRVTR